MTFEGHTNEINEIHNELYKNTDLYSFKFKKEPENFFGRIFHKIVSSTFLNEVQRVFRKGLTKTTEEKWEEIVKHVDVLHKHKEKMPMLRKKTKDKITTLIETINIITGDNKNPSTVKGKIEQIHKSGQQIITATIKKTITQLDNPAKDENIQKFMKSFEPPKEEISLPKEDVKAIYHFLKQLKKSISKIEDEDLKNHCLNYIEDIKFKQVTQEGEFQYDLEALLDDDSGDPYA